MLTTAALRSRSTNGHASPSAQPRTSMRPESMRILYHHRTQGDGAEGIHVAEIIAALKRLGHDVPLICPRAARRPPGLAEAPKGSTSGRPRPKLPEALKQALELAYNGISYRRTLSGIARYKPDFIYERYSSYNFGGVLAARRRKVPLILEVNATYTGDFESLFPVQYPSSLRRIESYVLRKASGIVVVSRALKSCVMKKGVQEECIQISPNAINPEKVAAVNREQCRAEIRSQLGLDDSMVVVGFVGSLRKWHGIDFFAQAIPHIAQKAPNARFLIVGTGECESELREVVAANNLPHAVHLVGAVPHEKVFPYISAMDVGVMPDSNLFGSPMKILEYMAMGCVPVGPALGPLEEIIEPEITGKLFARRDLHSFVGAITELCKEDAHRARIAANAIKYVLSERTWDRNAQEIVDLFLKTHVSRAMIS